MMTSKILSLSLPSCYNSVLISLLDDRVHILNRDFAGVMHRVTNTTLSKKLLNWTNEQQPGGGDLLMNSVSHESQVKSILMFLWSWPDGGSSGWTASSLLFRQDWWTRTMWLEFCRDPTELCTTFLEAGWSWWWLNWRPKYSTPQLSSLWPASNTATGIQCPSLAIWIFSRQHQFVLCPLKMVFLKQLLVWDGQQDPPLMSEK